MKDSTDNKENTIKDLTDTDMEMVTGGGLSGCTFREYCVKVRMKNAGCSESDQACRDRVYQICKHIPCS